MLLDPAALSATSAGLPSAASGIPSARAATRPSPRRHTGRLARLSAALRATHQARIPF